MGCCIVAMVTGARAGVTALCTFHFFLSLSPPLLAKAWFSDLLVFSVCWVICYIYMFSVSTYSLVRGR